MKQRTGFVGLGLMGSAMARRLLQSGFPLTVYNRTPGKAEALRPLGAVLGDSPGSAANQASVVVSMVSTGEALREVALAPNGILRNLREAAVHVDCSTVPPSLTRELEGLYREAGKIFVHCPVLGSVPQATDGSLLLMAGGSLTPEAKAVLGVLGNKMWTFERPEQASHAKLLCNSFIAGMIVTLTQAIVFARRAEVAPEMLLEIIANSALNAPTYQTKGKMILQGDFTPRFYVRHMLKDVTLIIEAARERGAPVPGLEVARELLQQAVSQGLGKEDYSAIIKVLEAQKVT